MQDSLPCLKEAITSVSSSSNNHTTILSQPTIVPQNQALLICLLFSPFRKYGKDLKVDVGNPCTFYVGTKAKELHFQEEQINRPQLRKSNAQSLILFWPTPSVTALWPLRLVIIILGSTLWTDSLSQTICITSGIVLSPCQPLVICFIHSKKNWCHFFFFFCISQHFCLVLVTVL